jgi:hypothetical protein
MYTNTDRREVGVAGGTCFESWIEDPVVLSRSIQVSLIYGSGGLGAIKMWTPLLATTTDRGRRNSLKARALLVVIVLILSLMKNSLDFNSLMFNKY